MALMRSPKARGAKSLPSPKSDPRQPVAVRMGAATAQELDIYHNDAVLGYEVDYIVWYKEPEVLTTYLQPAENPTATGVVGLRLSFET